MMNKYDEIASIVGAKKVKNMAEENEGQLISVGAAWINESKNGKKYLNVKFNKLLMFKNDKKKSDKEPDYRIVASVGGKRAAQSSL